MHRGKKLLHDTSLYGIAQFSASGLQLLALPIYTRYFPPAVFGLWDIFLAIMTILLPVISLELAAATYRWLLDKDTIYTTQAIIATGWRRLIYNSIIFTILSLLMALITDIPYLIEITIIINLLLISQFLQQCARGLQRNKLFALLIFLPTAITISFVIASSLYFPLGIHAFLYGNIIALCITIIIAWQQLTFWQYIKGKHNKTLLKQYLIYALPIIPAAISWMMITVSDRIIIAFFLGTAANGIYAIALKVPAILLMCNTVFSLAWKDNVLTYFNKADNKAYFMKVYLYYKLFLSVIFIILIILAKPLITIGMGSAYETAWPYSIMLLFAVFFQALSLFWAAIFHGMKQTNIIFHSTIAGVVCNLVLSFILVKPFGLYGVASASIIAFGVIWGMREYWGRIYVK